MEDFYRHFAEMFAKLLTPVGVLGLVGQGLFASRFIVQWIVSEKRGESVVPFSFWILSLVGCLILLVYASFVMEPVYFLGMVPGTVVYTRNIVLLRRHHSRISSGMIHGEKVIEENGRRPERLYPAMPAISTLWISAP